VGDRWEVDELGEGEIDGRLTNWEMGDRWDVDELGGAIRRSSSEIRS
jgi:hypothetical protein